EELGIADLAERSVYELSGGQRQLVALAAVLAVDPQILVLDEPTTLLDLRNRERLRVHLRALVDRRGVRLSLSTHDLEFAHLAQRALVVEDGRIACDAAPAEAVENYRDLIMSDTPGGGIPTAPMNVRASGGPMGTKAAGPLAGAEAPPRRRGARTPGSDRARRPSA